MRKTLVFVERKRMADTLGSLLALDGYPATTIHGYFTSASAGTYYSLRLYATETENRNSEKKLCGISSPEGAPYSSLLP